MSRIGHTSNHGMQSIDIKKEAAKENETLTKGRKVCCPYCSEAFHFNKNDVDCLDIVRIESYLRAKRCPYCQEGWKLLTKNVQAHAFIVGGRTFNCLKKPAGWKPAGKEVDFNSQLVNQKVRV